MRNSTRWSAWTACGLVPAWPSGSPTVASSRPRPSTPPTTLDGGRVCHADRPLEVTVRYSRRVCRWLLERGEGAPEDDGSVVVTHTVADPGWLVRHVLRYGPDAEVRGWVGEAVSVEEQEPQVNTDADIQGAL